MPVAQPAVGVAGHDRRRARAVPRQVHTEGIDDLGAGDLVPGQDPNTGSKTPEQWFNKAAFVIPTSSSSLFVGRFGNAGNGIIDGPGFISVDVGAFKEFAIRESLRLRVQTQIRNFPNHPNLGAPEGNLNSANYGRITTLNAGATARVVVVGARLIF